MKTTVLKSIVFILLITSFGKLKAQSDLLFADLSSSGSANSLVELNTDAKISIGNIVQDNSTNTSRVKIKCQSPVSIMVKVFTMNGDLAKEEAQSLESGVNELTINMDDLSAGTYMIQFYTNEGSALRRIVKMN